jgi:type IV fimbrial biogenesis protein FimT
VTRRRPPRSRGFTLFEVMFVLVLLSVMALIMAPGMREFVVAQRVKSLAYDLASDLMLARSEALKRGAIARLEPRGTGFESGWIVSVGNLVLGWRGGGASGVVVDGAPQAISFNPGGRVAAPATQLRMTVRVEDGADATVTRCVELDLSGRVQQRSGACS